MSALRLTMGELAMIAEGRIVQAAHLAAQRAGVPERVATEVALARREELVRAAALSRPTMAPSAGSATRAT